LVFDGFESLRITQIEARLPEAGLPTAGRLAGLRLPGNEHSQIV
jgi:hypothetical protein